eukprot:scaffold276_cov132-Cylindrotheca_fusiformis.AAC.16
MVDTAGNESLVEEIQHDASVAAGHEELTNSVPVAPEIQDSNNNNDAEAMEDVNLMNDDSSSSEDAKKSAAMDTDLSVDDSSSLSNSKERSQASGWAQILALMRKNFLSKIRSPLATFFELLSPVALMLILAAAFTLSDITDEPAAIYVNPVIRLPGPFVDLFQRSAFLFGGDFDLASVIGSGRRRRLSGDKKHLLQQSERREKMPSSWDGVFDGLEQKLEAVMKEHARTLAAGRIDEGYGRRLQQIRNRVDTSDDEDALSYELLDDAEDELEKLLVSPIPTPTFSEYVSASAALSTAIPIESLPRIFAESSFGYQWGNLLTLGTLHLSPRTAITQEFWTYLNNTFPDTMASGFLNSTNLRVRIHDDEATALAYIDDNNLVERTWALVDFSQFDLDQEESAYKIRMNFTTVPNTNRVTRWASIGLSDRFQRYYLSGYMSLQRTINEFAMNMSGCEADFSSIFSGPMPTAAYSQNPFFLQVGYLLGLTMVMAFLYPTSRLIKTIVEEKETKMKETLLILGVREWAHWLSWFFTSLIIFLFITITVTFTLTSTVLQFSNPGYIFLYILLFSTSTIGFCNSIASLFSRAKLAGIIGPVALFATILPRFIFFGSNRYENTTGKMIASLCPATAFCFGADIIADYEYAEQGVQDWNSGEGEYSFDTTLAFLLLDTALYIFLGWYLDQVVPRQYGVARPFYFLFMPSYWFGNCSKKGGGKPESVADDRSAAESSPDVEQVQDVSLIPRVQIKNLVKQYFKGKTAYPPAVDGLNLSMYESQISTLLGHNGSGKTTTVSVMTGLFPPTSGDCVLYGNSIVHNMHEARQSLGICPQHNILFADLTVYEHLSFFMRIKGLEPERTKILDHAAEIGLADYVKTTASALSGGNKRKLSVAIALCGDPDVLILDEPTSAMDPHSRRAVWELLGSKKKGRVTLLTTHFMDEAELLSDRIAVIKGGKLQCCGSSMFLKDRFGLGYSITVVVEPPATSADEEGGTYSGEEKAFAKQKRRLAEFLDTHIPGTKLVRTSGKELTFRFPQGTESMFQKTFDDLEVQRESLGVGAYGIQNSSLEEVFLQLAEDNDVNEDQPEGPVCDAIVEELEYSHLSPLRQIGLLYGKRLAIQRRDKKGACFTIILPVLVIALVLVILMVEPPIVGKGLEMSPAIFQTSAGGESNAATNIAIGGRSVGTASGEGIGAQINLLKDGIGSRYENTEFTTNSGASSSLDLSEYLLATYSNRDHATRFGAYILNDLINYTVDVDLAATAAEVDPDLLLSGLTNVSGSRIDLAALSGLQGDDGTFRFTSSFSDLGIAAAASVGISPNATSNTVSQFLSFCAQLFLPNEVMLQSEVAELVDVGLVSILSANNSTNLTLEAIDSFLKETFTQMDSGNATDANGGEEALTDVDEVEKNNGTEANMAQAITAKQIDVAVLTRFIESNGPYNRGSVEEALDDLLNGIVDSFDGDSGMLPTGAEVLNLFDFISSELNGNEASNSDTTNALAIASTIVLRETLRDTTDDTIKVGTLVDGFFEALVAIPVNGDFPIPFGNGTITIQASSIMLNTRTSLTLEAYDLNITLGDQPFIYLPAASFDLLLALGGFQTMIPRQFILPVEAQATILHNSTSDHAVAAFNQAYMEQLYGQCRQSDASRLKSINEPLPITSQQTIEVKTILSIVAALFLLIPYCYIPGAFIVFLVKERISKSKHLQLVSGVNMTSYWLATYLWDVSLFFLLTILVMAIFLAYGNQSAQVFVGDAEAFFATAALTFGYGLSVLPFSYLLARNFSNPSTAQISVIGLVFVSGFVAVK